VSQSVSQSTRILDRRRGSRTHAVLILNCLTVPIVTSQTPKVMVFRGQYPVRSNAMYRQEYSLQTLISLLVMYHTLHMCVVCVYIQ